MKSQLIAALGFAVILSAAVSRPATKLLALADLPPEEPLEVCDLVIRGTVVSVAPGEFDLSNGAPGTTPAILKSFTTQFSVAEVLRGKWDKPEVTFAILRDSSPMKVGGEFIVCGIWNINRGMFVSGPYIGVYEKNSDGSWEKRGGGEKVDKIVLTPSDVRSHLERGSLNSIVSQSSLIARGNITGIEESSFTNDQGQQVFLHVYKMTVAELYKGNDDDGQIQFVVPYFGRFVPAWTRRCPDLRSGEEWLVFLKRGDEGLFPFGGANSLLQVKGSRLWYKAATEYPIGLSETGKQIRAEGRRAKQ